jgi:hypothetical protein
MNPCQAPLNKAPSKGERKNKERGPKSKPQSKTQTESQRGTGTNYKVQSQGWALGGWSELAATNAPVADEPVEAVFRMNENPILPARIFIFFFTSSLPQNFPPSYLPPPTCHLPPPSYLPPTNPSPLTPSPELQRR